MNRRMFEPSSGRLLILGSFGAPVTASPSPVRCTASRRARCAANWKRRFRFVAEGGFCATRRTRARRGVQAEGAERRIRAEVQETMMIRRVAVCDCVMCVGVRRRPGRADRLRRYAPYRGRIVPFQRALERSRRNSRARAADTGSAEPDYADRQRFEQERRAWRQRSAGPRQCPGGRHAQVRPDGGRPGRILIDASAKIWAS